MSHSLDILFGRQAESHRTHAHPLNVVKLHSTNSAAEFFKFFFHVPRFHSRDVRRTDRGIPRTVRVVTRDASLEHFLSSSSGVRGAQTASRETQCANQERQRPSRDPPGGGFLNFAHAEPQRN